MMEPQAPTAGARSLSPPAPAVVVIDDVLRQHAGAFYKPALWQLGTSSRESRPKQERDSLRSRSKEGRPGSRKHRRWTRSVELVGSLRRVMAASGEVGPTGDDADGVTDQGHHELRPSAFYRLLEHEGPGQALEAWAAAEASRGHSPRARARNTRTKDAAQIREERERAVRRAFGETFQWLQRDTYSQELLAEIEVLVEKAFGSCEHEPGFPVQEADAAAEDAPWLVCWDGEVLLTKSGAPPASELELLGLDAPQRKVVHQFARVLGLHSESRGTAAKVIALRPTRGSRCGPRQGRWHAPFSVSQVLAAAC